MKLECKINGEKKSFECRGMERLLDVIREKAGLTGVKEGCGEGECGACAVMMNGRLVNSCLVPAIQAEGAEITTIEGVASEGTLSKVQQAFLEHGGAQCGICTPGMVLAATDLISRTPNPTQEDICAGLAGNLCRCTGYKKIFESVVHAVKDETQGKKA